MTTKNNRLLIIFTVLVLTYMAISIGLPPNPKSLQQYQLTALNARLLNLSFVVPLAAVWMVAYYGYARFKDYANRVHNTHEGASFHLIEKGVMILVFTLPVQGIITASTNYYFINHAGAQPTLTIMRNYLYMLLFTSAFLLIARGCSSLLLSLKKVPHRRQSSSLTLAIVVLSTLFVSLIINKRIGTQDTTYFLPTWLVVTTIAIPYLYAWSRALQGLFDLGTYLRLIKGKIYKSALRAVVIGLGAVTTLNILIQLLTAATSKINRLNLTPILLIIYMLVFCYAIGFGLMARGSRKLTQIEEA